MWAFYLGCGCGLCPRSAGMSKRVMSPGMHPLFSVSVGVLVFEGILYSRVIQHGGGGQMASVTRKTRFFFWFVGGLGV